MRIGLPKEIKNHEYRVGMVPDSVHELVSHGHEVMVQHDAGVGIGCEAETYRRAGAIIAQTADEIFAWAEMIIKVKEPQPEEYRKLREGQILFTYLHLAPDAEQAAALQKSGCIAIAYETVTDARGGLPLLSPMSEVAGRMSIQAGSNSLEKGNGGSGILLGGVPGVAPAHVVVLGGGVAGINAIRLARGMEARVTVIDKSLARLRELDLQFDGLNTVFSTKSALEKYVADADLLIGAVLVPGAAAPKLVTKLMLKTMRPGSVMVDIAIDQGGCFETSRPTTHQDPTYILDGIVHYCVTNMPGAVPRTSTFALNNATLPFILALANKGYKRALLEDHHLMAGLNVYHGKITNQAVAEALGEAFEDPHLLL